MFGDNNSDDGESSEGESAEPQAPKIEFPCVYPIKVIGKAGANFQADVIAAVEKHTGKLAADLIDIRPSKKQNYVSVRLAITATGEEQLRDIFLDLKAIENVKLVL